MGAQIRRGKAWAATGEAPPDYEAGAVATLEVVRAWLRAHPEQAPRFRFPPAEMALIGSLADIGERLALDEAAREVIASLLALKSARGFNDHPTAMMLRAALQICRVPVESCGLSDLGLRPAGGGGGWQ